MEGGTLSVLGDMPSREHLLGVANTAHPLEDRSLSGRSGVGCGQKADVRLCEPLRS